MTAPTWDETLTTTSGQTYGFRLGVGQHGFSTTTNPFAAKSTQGDRSYSDYDILQAIALSDFAGGFGQERMEAPNRYWNTVNVDARGGKLVLGPLPTYMPSLRYLSCGQALASTLKYSDSLPDMVWESAYTPGRPQLAAYFDCPTDVNSIAHIWLPLRVRATAGTITVRLCNSVASGDGRGQPGTVLGSASITRDAATARGAWAGAAFSSTISVAPGSRYWVTIEHNGSDTEAVQWLSLPDSEANAKTYDGSTWSWASTHLVFWFDDPTVYPGGPLHLLIGAGEDGITRLWGWSGRHVYYVGASGQVTPVQSGLGSVYEASAEIQDAVWFRGTGDAHPYLYVALGAGTGIVKFDGNIGAEQWFTVSAISAQALAVYEEKLWYASGNQLNYTTTGSTAGGSAVAVGQAATSIRRMCSWNGQLMIGKRDGLYRGFRDGGTFYVQSVVDFWAQSDDNNFSFMIDHQGDLYFPIALGLMRYTAAGVLVSMAAESGTQLAAAARGYYRAAASSLGVLWAAVEGPPDGYSAIMAHVDGGWHPVLVGARLGDPMASLVVDPGLYGDNARLWYASGLQLASAEVPMTTLRRWTYAGLQWSEEGIWESSWLDGNLRTVIKDWLRVELDVENVEPDGSRVAVYYRDDEGDAWTLLGTVTTVGVSQLDMPSGTYSSKLQLRLRLIRGNYAGSLDTPRVNAVIVKYLERPDVVHTHMRTYVLSPAVEARGGAPVTVSVADQIEWLRALASEKEPLTWRPWYGGAARQVHILRYNAIERREEVGSEADQGSVMVVVQLQEV